MVLNLNEKGRGFGLRRRRWPHHQQRKATEAMEVEFRRVSPSARQHLPGATAQAWVPGWDGPQHHCPPPVDTAARSKLSRPWSRFSNARSLFSSLPPCLGYRWQGGLKAVTIWARMWISRHALSPPPRSGRELGQHGRSCPREGRRLISKPGRFADPGIGGGIWHVGPVRVR
jgi:hypothetical protein